MRLPLSKLTELEESAYRIRRLTRGDDHLRRWGHIGGSFSMAELLAVLYFQAMRLDPARPDGKTATG